ncbi:MAG: phosphatidate cytidylyltransferase [Myxococcota bacterium]
MGTRLVAGLTGLAVILPILIWGGPTAVFWLIVPFLVIGLDEYVKMAVPDAGWPGRVLFWGTGAALYAIVAAFPAFAATAIALACMGAMLVPMFREPDVGEAANRAIRYGFGLVYVPVLMAPLARIRLEEDGLALVFLVLASTWLGDTGAYFAGRFFGKTPLFPRVSPKKTVEGVVGGLLLSMIGACVVKYVGGLPFSYAAVAVLGGVLDLAGVVGDLAESMLKRAFGVKDSGWIMPGHGGILDRIDSLLFSAPLLWLVLQMQELHGV